MSNKIKIVISGHADGNLIDAAVIDPGYFLIEVENKFLDNSQGKSDINLATVNKRYSDAFKDVIDFAAYIFEENAFVWKISLSNNILKLENSFIRDKMDTNGILTNMPDGKPLKMKFEVPGFSSSNYREIDLWYNQDFSPADLSILEEIGITLTGNGREIHIVNAIECKISFSKPPAIAGSYIIDFDGIGLIVPPFQPVL